MSFICDTVSAAIVFMLVVSVMLMAIASILSFTFMYVIFEPIIRLSECDDDDGEDEDEEGKKSEGSDEK